MKVYFDFECNGLLRQNPFVVHCMAWAIDNEPVTLAVGADEVRQHLRAICQRLVAWQQSEQGLGQKPKWVAHYGTGFDNAVLRRLGVNLDTFGWELRDTKVLGSLYDPEFSGTHSLEAWGERVRAPKMDFKEGFVKYMLGKEPTYQYMEGDEWVAYTPVMGEYCTQDVNTLRCIDQYIVDRYERDFDWGFSVALEHGASEVMAEQAHVGWWYDKEWAAKLHTQFDEYINTRTELVRKLLVQRCVHDGDCDKPFKKDGLPTANAMRWLGVDPDEFDAQVKTWKIKMKADLKAGMPADPMPSTIVAGPFSRVSFVDYDIDSRMQVIELLMKYGWKPTEFTEVTEKGGGGNPKFSADTVLPDNIGAEGKALGERLIALTRQGQLRGWDSKVRPDGRIEAKAMSQATPTGRMRHSVVVNVPKVGTLWGKEMRSLFGAPPGKVQVGVDASGLELRMLAHYMGDPEFTETLLKGDIHWYMAGKMGLRDPDAVRQKEGPLADLHHRIRECEKRWIYALIYGAADAKLGEVLGEFDLPGWYGTEAEGALVRQRVMIGLPKLGKLMERIQHTLFETFPDGKINKRKKKRTWLLGLDGRKLYVRHDHAALNTLLQSAGSIVVKAATVFTHKQIKRLKLKARQVGHFHDEAQYECADEATAKQVAELFIKGIKWAEQKFKVRCPLDGEYKIGKTWADCH